MNSPAPIAGPHTHAPDSIAKVMFTVVLALLPATLFGIWQFGWPALFLFVITLLAALLAEAACLHIAGRPQKPFLLDGSALLTGWLLAMSLPPWAPWWIGVVGALFAIVVGKHVFGGLGQNPFNPAMLARVALLISFPVEMTLWVDPSPFMTGTGPDLIEGLAITLFGVKNIDAVSGATVLGHIKTEMTRGHDLGASLPALYDMQAAAVGNSSGSLGETSALLILGGGVFLILRRVITWHIPLAMLGTVALLAGGFHLADPLRYADPAVHLLTGALMLGAFFIATDLVTSPVTRLGQVIFGAGCGALVFVIRTWGGFPEGVGFAVLLMNAATPLIEHYTRPRIFGRSRSGAPREYPEPAERKEH